MPTKQKIRRRGDSPANWQWRDGRPRWIPAPGLRAAGWKGHDLKAADGMWLGKGASIDAAEAINAAVKAWRAGGLVEARFAAVAPAHAIQGAAGPAAHAALAPARHAIGRLVDEYCGAPATKMRPAIPACNEFLELRAKTQSEYRSKLKRMVDTLAGYAILPARDATAADLAAYAAAVAATRAEPIYVLATPEDEDDGDGLLYTAYWLLRDKVSLHMANGVMAVASAWLEWIRKRKRIIKANPANDVDRSRAPGRIRPATWDQLAAIIQAAEAGGFPSIADSFILGVDLSWSQSDRLALTWAQISGDLVRHRRLKTNRPGEVRLLEALGKPRLAEIKARQAAALGPGGQFTHVLICESTGRPWKGDHYRHAVAQVRAAADLICPGAGEVYDKDMRSTAVTVAYDAGLDPVEIAGRTAHSLRQVQDMLDNHYGQVRREVGDRGAKKLNAHLKKKGIRL